MRASVVLLLLVTSNARAAGFAVGEQGAAAFGMAGAVTGLLDAPDMGFYNPAAWALGPEGLRAALGATAIAPSLQHEHPATGARTDAKTQLQLPPYAHAAINLGRVALGVTFGVPFGSGLGWPDGETWAGRFEITDIDLKTFEFAPSVAVRLLDNLALAGGPRVYTSSVYLARKVDLINSEGAVELGGDAQSVGGQLALALGPIGPVSVGLTYRSRVQLEYTGLANFEDIPREFQASAKDGAVRTSLTLPDRLALGGALALNGLRLCADLEYVRWSSFARLDLDFEDPATPDVQQARRWHDTLAVRLGVEQRELVTGLTVRGGFAYDPTPSPTETLSPSLPDADRLLLTLGASYALGPELTAHLSYGHVVFLGAEASGEAFPGRYSAAANLFSVGLSYRARSVEE